MFRGFTPTMGLGFRVQGLGFTPAMEKNMENETDWGYRKLGLYSGL